MPPMEPPTTEAHRSMPRLSATSAWQRTMSRIETTGNDEPYGSDVSGSQEAGPVLPWHPPRTFTQTTNNSSVSSTFPGPIRASHQPGVG